MLLPIFAIGVTCGYAMFNKNAYLSYANGNVNNTKYVEVNVLENDTNYVYKQDSLLTNPFDRDYIFKVENIKNYYLPNMSSNLQYYIENNLVDNFRLSNYNGNPLLNFRNANNENIQNFQLQNSLLNFEFTLITVDVQPINYYSLFKQIELINPNTIDNVFYYSVDKVTQSPLFSWAYDSFLSAPFVYILDLFGVPSTHVMVELLSYWLSVSIIWLVFDLIMYVPLLMHRWIDKGVLE